ncbi:hypothetical protein Tco_1045623 [Tanacetum coccineum]|uniref:Uncharacterized protein n=1 Tax=Tanacetum coccineum TaxID=301880 RepID=A0ABQ5GTB3_9ASTR
MKSLRCLFIEDGRGSGCGVLPRGLGEVGKVYERVLVFIEERGYRLWANFSLYCGADDDYQGEIQGDAQEDKLTTAMMLLARAITQPYSTPTSNRLCLSSNTRNQAVIQDGHVDIQSKNVSYVGNGNRNVGRKNRNQVTNAGNGSF